MHRALRRIGSRPRTTAAVAASDYTFDYGDSSTPVTNATGTAAHTYTDPGTYTVTLTVTDADANTGSVTETVTTLGSDYTAYGPTRILDTRNGTGESGTAAKIAAGGTISLEIGGNGTIPTAATAAVLNLTVTDETEGGFIIAYPDGGTRPTTSNLDYSSDVTLANYAVVPVGSDGKIDVYNSSTGTTNLLADVTGFFSTAGTSSYVPITPIRSLDTRTIIDGTVCSDCDAQDTSLTTADDVTSYAVNTTVTSTTSGGYLIVYPAGATRPVVSNLNWAEGATVANSTYATPSSTGIYCYNYSTGTINVVIDEFGYYASL
jgi:PKD repeat protein